MRFPRLLRQEHIIGGTAILALTQLGASLMGFVRDASFARTFVDRKEIIDIYFASFRPSDFLFQACIAAAMGTVLVPILASYRAHDKREEISKVLSASMLLGSLFFGAIALIFALILPVIAHLLTEFEGEKLELYIRFARIALVSNFLFVFGNTLGQYLITAQKYWVYGLTPILYTAGTILGTVFLTPFAGEYGPILGTVAGTGVYVLLRLFDAVRLGFFFRWTLWHPQFPEMGKLMLPRAFSLGAMQLQLLIFDRVASGLPEGSIAINAFSRNFQSVLVGVTGIALAQSAYSLLGQSAAWKNTVLFKKYLRWGIGALLAITIPGSIVLLLLAPTAARIMGIEPLKLFLMVLGIYALSIPFESMNHLLLRAFYATKQTLVPALLACLNAAIAIGVSWSLSSELGIFSLGWGFTLGQIAQMLGLLFLLPLAFRRVQKSTQQPAGDISVE